MNIGVFEEYIAGIGDQTSRTRMHEVLTWVADTYPDLELRVAWNQPMFIDHGTFIIGFSTAKHHFALSPEKEGVAHFSQAVTKAGYTHTSNLIRVPWDMPVAYGLLAEIIDYNIQEKKDCKTFWRKG